MEALTSEELTRAFVLAIQGDDKMTPEDKVFVWDVIRRQANEDAERWLRFFG